ncbi:hypothetical protein LX32DRAFT_304318 [Colletotrichum zoysiae]|uniref:Uncharacterized protein n=1 Tax=Colletotrichum zoysiae TaxID=1216348 RepID=A0AAD9H2B2_9PEZI|nr:hypothetical protein LX32DRAFT_304318 [Colletotrichum zoysiae]
MLCVLHCSGCRGGTRMCAPLPTHSTPRRASPKRGTTTYTTTCAPYCVYLTYLTYLTLVRIVRGNHGRTPYGRQPTQRPFLLGG